MFRQTKSMSIASSLAVAVMIMLNRGATGEEVYRADFERADKLSRHWSNVRRNISRAGARTFLGDFVNETVTLTLDELPKHEYLKISFDLFVIRNWGGNKENCAPDLWQLSVEDGPLLVNTTFSLYPENDGYTQSYPANYPLGDTIAYTGAAEKNSLGFLYDRKYGVRDAVYRMSFVFPHRPNSVVFNFSAMGERITPNRGAQKGSWGLDNVIVETLDNRPVKKLSDTELRKAWENLSQEDSIKGHQAVWALINSGSQAVELLNGKLTDTITSVKPESLIRQLDDDEFRVRDAATQKLIALAPLMPGLTSRIEAASKAAKSDEVRVRLAQILAAAKSASGTSTPLFRRLWRARYILDVIGTDEAKKVKAAAFPFDKS